MNRASLLDDATRTAIETFIAAATELRSNRDAIAAYLATPDGPADVDAIIQDMRGMSALTGRATRELSKTADVLVAARRRFRVGFRA